MAWYVTTLPSEVYDGMTDEEVTLDDRCFGRGLTKSEAMDAAKEHLHDLSSCFVWEPIDPDPVVLPEELEDEELKQYCKDNDPANYHTRETLTYKVEGNGLQSPFGDGEIIAVHRTLNTACRAARKWYNPATVRDSNGTRYDVYTQQNIY